MPKHHDSMRVVRLSNPGQIGCLIRVAARISSQESSLTDLKKLSHSIHGPIVRFVYHCSIVRYV